LINFLEQAALVSDVDGWKAEAAAVPFMTLHSAKGLEFDAVFIVGVEEGLLPHYRALQDRAHGSEQGALEEERRLFYVGMTRARERLFITHGRRRVTRGRDEAADPSRFLDELPADSVDRRQATRSSRPGGGFRKEMDYVLKKKRLTLQILDGGDGVRLAKGVAVKHPRYGEGRILKVEPMGARHMVRVNFADHGTMALLLSSEDVGTE
jgi:DNA helicase-2/ATP-dependent DNA helicase PcrA